ATNEMDWVNVMCYDFDFANHSTYAAATDGMNQWSSYGVAKDKLVMGTPFYGRYGTSWSDTHSKTYATILSDYKTLNGNYPPIDVDSYVDAAGHTTYFNGVSTIEKKMAFVRDNAFGGAMIWELGQDHWDASAKYDAYSLLPAINSVLRPPSWVTPASGSLFDYVAHTFYAHGGSVTLNASAAASDPTIALVISSPASVAAATVALGASQKFSSVTIDAGDFLDVRTKSLAVDYSGASPAGTWNGSA